MQVVFNIPGRLREFTGNQSAVRVEVESGANLLQALQALFQEFPDSVTEFLPKQARLDASVNIFVAT